MAVLAILFIVLVVFCLIKLTTRPTNFPPGPRGLPFLGYFPLLPKNEPAFKVLQKLAKIYGPVTGFFVGPTQPLISVAGQKAVKEALHNDDLNGRPDGAVFRSRTFGQSLGLVFVEGEFWQEQRRFTLRHLRDLGFGKTSIEDQMMGEINDLISEITNVSKSDPDHIVDFKSIFIVSIINILWAIIGGKRFQRDDLQFKTLLTIVENFVQGSNVFRAVIPIPATLLRLFPSLLKRIGVNTQLFIPIQKFIEESIEEHISTRSEGDLARDFMDIYLDEMEEQENKNPSTSFKRNQLVAAIQDLFFAGSETSSSTIGFVILHIINYPEVQRKMQSELDDVCGDYLPSLAHRTNLPYTEAVLMESLRMKNVAPMTPLHRAVRDTQLQGYTIPKGSFLSVNLDSVFKDPLIWEDPEVFNPNRHLDANNKLIKNDTLTPFGIGKRICLGEPLARNTIFLFTAALVKTFEFKIVPNEPPPSLEPVAGLTLSPKPFKAVVIPRKPIIVSN